MLCSGIAACDSALKEYKAEKFRSEAKKNMEKVYWDGDGANFRATETNEITFHRVINNRDEDVGIKTHRVYKSVDHDQTWERRVADTYDNANKRLTESNQKFYWKRMETWDYITSKDKRLGYAQIDKENGKAIWSIKSYDNKKTFCIMYADTTSPHGGMKAEIVNGNTKFDERYISSEEYYNYYWLIQNEVLRK